MWRLDAAPRSPKIFTGEYSDAILMASSFYRQCKNWGNTVAGKKSGFIKQSGSHRLAFRVPALIASAVSLLLCGCSASAPQATSEPSTSTQIASQAAAPPSSVPSTTYSRDKTADFKTAKKNAPWLSAIKSVAETEPGRIRVETKLVDPRGASGGEEAKSAVAICESVVTLFGPKYVSILEDDGTTSVLFGHPSVPSGACAEV